MQPKLCLGVVGGASVAPLDQLPYIKSVGFDGFFMVMPHHGDAYAFRREADRLGLFFQSIHAPFHNAAHMWEADEAAALATKELLDCVDVCHGCGVDTMVVHPFIGFFDTYTPTENGLNNFAAVARHAATRGVRIAFENVEGESLLTALMETFVDNSHVGFCWDSGHEICYGRDRDMLSLYGDRLIATHLNDNRGISGDHIDRRDDLHLLPFDGKKDWSDAMARLDRCGYDGPMTFELKISPEIDAKCGTDYAAISFEDYLSRVYSLAVRLCGMRCKL